MRHPTFFSLPILVAALFLGGASLEALAESGQSRKFDIAPQALDMALLEFSEQAEVQLVVAARSLENLNTPGFTGEGTAERVLVALLDQTSLTFRTVGNTFSIVNGEEGSVRTDDESREEPDDMTDRESETDEPEAFPGDGGETKEEPANNQPLELEVQTVTGSRLAADWSQISRQVILLTADDLLNTGAATLEQALRQLPQNVDSISEFGGAGLVDNQGGISPRLLGSANIHGSSTVNLRGLGDSATLILIDGKRLSDNGVIGGFVDISDYPISMIERVEVSLDGGSSIYGSDAIGGVINIITKKVADEYREVMLRRKVGTDGFPEYNASFLVNVAAANGTGNVTFAFDAYQTPGQTFAQVAENVDFHFVLPLTGDAGHITPSGWLAREISPVLTLAAREAGLIPADERVILAPIPAGQDGTSLTIRDFLTDEINSYGEHTGIPRISVVPSSDRYVFRIGTKLRISDSLQLNGGFRYGTRKTHNDSGGAGGHDALLSYTVFADNPFNPFGRNVRVSRPFPDIGPKVVTGDRESLMLDLDLEGTFRGSWRWELRSRFSSGRELGKALNVLNRAELTSRELLDAGLTVFGDSFLTDGNNAQILEEAGIELVFPRQQTETNHALLASEILMRGTVLSLPAGEIGAVWGIEWRKKRMKVDYGNSIVEFLNPTSPIGVTSVEDTFLTAGERILRAAFVEAFVPVVSKRNALPGVRDLGITLSGRHESAAGASNEGSDTHSRYKGNVWSVGLAWRPVEAIRLRVNKSTSFRSPEIAQSLLAPVVHPSQILFDLRFGGGLFGLGRIGSHHVTLGGNPDLLPERGYSLNAGIDLRPDFIEGLSVGANYFQTDYVNRITSLNPFGVVFVNARSFAQYRFQFTTDEEGNIVATDGRNANVALRYTQGMDYYLNYRWSIGLNTFRFSANVSETHTLLEDIDAIHDLGEITEHAGESFPEHRYSVMVSWERGGWRLALNAAAASSLSYEQTQLLEIGGDPHRVTVRIEPATTVNLRGGYDVGPKWGYLKDMSFRFGVNNILRSYSRTKMDPEPGLGLEGVPRSVHSASGRAYYMEIRKRF